MKSRAIFYVLDGLDESQQLQFFCRQITERWREFRSVRVFCASQQQAEQLDEALWQQPADAFVPHNLCGEGPPQGAPVELCWPEATMPQRRVAAVVNFMDDIAPTAGARLIIDRVPTADAERQQARERYKAYRAQQIELSTQPAAEQT